MRQDDEVKKGSVRWKTLKANQLRREEESQRKIKKFIDNADDDISLKVRNTKKQHDVVDSSDVPLEPDMSIVSDYKHPAPAFPLDAFGDWADWITISAKSKCAPSDYVAMALLSATSSLLSNVRRGSPWKDWKEPYGAHLLAHRQATNHLRLILFVIHYVLLKVNSLKNIRKNSNSMT